MRMAVAMLLLSGACGEGTSPPEPGPSDAGALLDGGHDPSMPVADMRLDGASDLGVGPRDGGPTDLSGPVDLAVSDHAVPEDLGPPLSLVASFRVDAEQPLVGWLDLEGSVPFAWSMTVEAPGAPGAPRRDVASSGAYQRQWELPVLGFPEATELTIVIRGRTASGASASVGLSARTGTLGADVRPPDAELVSEAGARLGGYVLLGMILPDLIIYFAVDGEGSVVWHYTDRSAPGFATPLIRPQPDGTFALLMPGELRVIRPTGELVRAVAEPPGEGFHHDFQLLPDGNLLVLSYEDRLVDLGDEGPVRVLGDVILELDASGEEVARWSALDHLDATRFPGALSLADYSRPSGTARDWTHGNAIHFRASDRTILYSPRHQHQLVHLSWPRGEVLALYGEDGDYTLEPGGSWFYAQHAPMWSGPDRFLVYDNGNERPGGGRPFSRVVEYELEPEAGRARQLFSWTTPFYTPFVGDVDVLPSGRLLVTSGVSDGTPGSVYEVDRSGRTRWAARFAGGHIYRSEWLARFPLR